MKMKWKRTLALLLLLCMVATLMPAAAFAVEQTEDQSLTAAPADGDSGGETTVHTVTFYDYDGEKLGTAEVADQGSLSAEDIPASAFKNGAVVSYWYGGGTNYAAGELTEAMIVGDATFYAAYLVSYYTADGERLINTEFVLLNNKPEWIPQTTADGTAITGWKDSSGNTVTPGELVVDGDLSLYAQTGTEDPSAPYTVYFYDYDGTLLKTVTTEGGIIESALVPTSDCLNGESVNGWLKVYQSDLDDLDEGIVPDDLSEVFDLSMHNIMSDCAFIAAWKVSYVYESDEGKTEYAKVLVLDGESPTYVPDIVFKTEQTVCGWLDSDGNSVDPTEQAITADTVFTAVIETKTSVTLNTSSTVAYISGSAEADGTVYRFDPNGSLTRAQAAQMIYNLLSEESREMGPQEVSFSDVKSTSWYYTAVQTLASYGILNGTGDGKFEPNAYITRGNFVTMVSRLYSAESYTGASPFTDVTNTATSYYSAVMTAYVKGWVTGYEEADGTLTFRPLATITRAEAVKVLGGVLGRNADSADSKAKIDALDQGVFIDIDSSWAYYWIMDAATGGGASLPKTGLSMGRHTIDGSYYFVDSTGRFMREVRGVHEMSDGKWYFFRKAGLAAPVYSGGLRNLDGDLYLLSSDGSIIHDQQEGYDTRVYEYQGYLYYIQADGTLLQNEYFGPLYFCSNGYYTSKDDTLDSWVYGFISDILKSSKSQEDKLYDTYIKMRDYPKERYGDGYQGYGNRGEGVGKTYKQQACAFFENARGDCSAWSAALVYAARRIGYKAWIEEGKLGTGAAHAWEVIEIGGTKYTFDVEQEWGYMYMYYPNKAYRLDLDCWKMEYNPGQPITYGYRFRNSAYGRSGQQNIWSPYKPSTDTVQKA